MDRDATVGRSPDRRHPWQTNRILRQGTPLYAGWRCRHASGGKITRQTAHALKCRPSGRLVCVQDKPRWNPETSYKAWHIMTGVAKQIATIPTLVKEVTRTMVKARK